MLYSSLRYRALQDKDFSKFLQSPSYKFSQQKIQHYSCQGSFHKVPHSQTYTAPEQQKHKLKTLVISIRFDEVNQS